MPTAAAAYALLAAVCTLTSGAPSIRHISLSTPDSSTATTVTLTDRADASATAASTIRRLAPADSAGRITQVPDSMVISPPPYGCLPGSSSAVAGTGGQQLLRIPPQPAAVAGPLPREYRRAFRARNIMRSG